LNVRAAAEEAEVAVEAEVAALPEEAAAVLEEAVQQQPRHDPRPR